LPEGISVVIPVYNAEVTIDQVCARLVRVLEGQGLPFEIVLVEDRGRDRSWDVICGLARSDSRVRGLRMRRNYGQHAAILCGLRAACYSVSVTIDDDLQHPPEEIPALLEVLNSGYDVVYGRPRQDKHGLFRNLASRLTKLALQSSMGAETARDVSAFRAIRTSVRDAFTEFRAPFVVIDVLLTWGTSRFTSIEVSHEPREVGVSNYTFRMLVTHAVNMMTGFSAVPLQVASVGGLVMSVFGFGVLGYVLVMYAVNGQTVPGFTFLASVIALFSGVQLFSIGVIGEYIARMHFRLMDRPAYVVGDYAVVERAAAGDGRE